MVCHLLANQLMFVACIAGTACSLELKQKNDREHLSDRRAHCCAFGSMGESYFCKSAGLTFFAQQLKEKVRGW